jgi:hypothetical protein
MLIIKNNMFKTKDKDDQKTTSCQNYQFGFQPLINLPKALFDEVIILKSIGKTTLLKV